MDDSKITPDDRERIRKYLEKPPHFRDADDLIPDEDASLE